MRCNPIPMAVPLGLLMLCGCTGGGRDLDNGAIQRWTVSSAPILSLGSERSGLIFEAVSNVTWVGDTLLAVADRGGHRIALVSIDGKVAGTIGRAGDGPGEFQSIEGLWTLDGGKGLAAYDHRQRRVTRFLIDGRPIATVAVRANGGVYDPVIVRQVLADGTIIVQASPSSAVAQNGSTTNGSVRATDVIASFTEEGTFRTILASAYRDTEYYVTSISGRMVQVPMLFGARALTALAGSYLFLAASDTAVISWMEVATGRSGDFKVHGAEREIEAGDVGTLMGNMMGAARNERGREILQAVLREIPLPSHTPPIGQMVGGSAGEVWVSGTVLPRDQITTWTVFRPESGVRAVVDLPARFSPMAVNDSAVAGIARDEYDVQHLQVFRLRRQ